MKCYAHWRSQNGIISTHTQVKIFKTLPSIVSKIRANIKGKSLLQAGHTLRVLRACVMCLMSATPMMPFRDVILCHSALVRCLGKAVFRDFLDIYIPYFFGERIIIQHEATKLTCQKN